MFERTIGMLDQEFKNIQAEIVEKESPGGIPSPASSLSRAGGTLLMTGQAASRPYPRGRRSSSKRQCQLRVNSKATQRGTQGSR